MRLRLVRFLWMVALVLIMIDQVPVSAQSYQSYTIPYPGFYPSTVRAVRVDEQDRVWVGSRLQGIALLDGSSWNLFHPDSGYPIRYLNTLSIATDTLWIGTDSGLVRKVGTSWQRFTTANSGIPSDSVTSLLVRDGKVYVGLKDGMAILEDTSWVMYDSTNSTLNGKPIHSIAANQFGVYVADKQGIFRLSPGGGWLSIRDYTYVYELVADRDGRVWFNQSGFDYRNCRYIFDTIVREPDSAYFTNACPSGAFDWPYRSQMVCVNRSGKVLLYVELPERPTTLRTILPTDRVDSILAFTDRFFTPWASGQLGASAADFNESGCFAQFRNHRLFVTYFDSMQTVEPDTIASDECSWLDKNMALCRLSNSGFNFLFRTADFYSAYEVPARSGIMAVKLQTLWLGALNEANDTLHFAGHIYGLSGADFWPGPLDTLQGQIDSATSIAYDRFWKIERSELEEFYWNYLQGNVGNGTYPIPSSILNWPAHGTGNYSRRLAPFHDTNQDGVYNPYDGDYPEMKGDQMLWWVMNDNLGPHTESDALHNLGFEIQCSAYAFNCPQPAAADSAINYTTFYSYKIINRSQNNYSDLSLGLFTAWHLGNYEDNYVGCDSVNSFVYVYNADDDDEAPDAFMGDRVYGSHPPMVSLVTLKGLPALPADGVDNDRDGATDEAGECHLLSGHTWLEQAGGNFGIPRTAQRMFQSLNSRWLDSTRVTYGGFGYNPGSTDYTRYIYSGDPYSGTGWTEQTAAFNNQPNYPDRRQSLSISGPSAIGPGQSIDFDYAYVFSRVPDQPNGLNTSVARNRFDVLRVKHWFETDSFPCSNGVIGIAEQDGVQDFEVFPSPASDHVSIQLHSLLQGAEINLLNFTGQVVRRFQCNSTLMSLSVRDLPAGIYAIRLTAKSHRSQMRWLVVQH